MLDRLPAELLHVIMTEAIPVVSCTCTGTCAEVEQVAVQQLAAQMHAHDELQAERVAAAAAARRRRSSIRRAFVVGGAVTGATLLLAAAWSAPAKGQRREAPAAALCPPADGWRAVNWSFVLPAVSTALMVARRRK